MRKETWFRGPLLSVLFFALVIGGGGSAFAGSPTSVTSASHLNPQSCAAMGGYWNLSSPPPAWDPPLPGAPRNDAASGHCISNQERCAQLNGYLVQGAIGTGSGILVKIIGKIAFFITSFWGLEYLQRGCQY